jgi:ADP-heptose:LPS heptosyltransferase
MTRELDREPASVAILRARTGLGDLLCGVPALRALRSRLPRAHVALITFAEMAPVVERDTPDPDRAALYARLLPVFDSLYDALGRYF